jgi:hypothetical protein
MYPFSRRHATLPPERRLPLVISGSICLRAIPYVIGYYVPISILYVLVHDAVLLIQWMGTTEIRVMGNMMVVVMMWLPVFPVRYVTLEVDAI